MLWSAETNASLADLECRVDESVDRAAAGKVCLLDLPQLEARPTVFRVTCRALGGYQGH